MIKKTVKNVARLRKHDRVRKKVSGTNERPRLNVYRSLNHIYAQIIDDTKSTTLVSASTLDSSVKSSVKNTGNIEAATEVGKLIAKRAKECGIDKVVFDRGGYIYHGRVKALAEGARAEGLNF